MSDLHNKPGENMDGLPSYQDLENAVLNGATAIHCLTAERNQLRGRVEAQEAELESLRTTNEHLRRQLLLIGDSYLKYAASCASHETARSCFTSVSRSGVGSAISRPTTSCSSALSRRCA